MTRRGIDAYAAGDLETALAIFSPEVEIFAPPGEQITTGTYRGIEGFLEWAGEWNDAWERFELELVSVEAVGERHAVAVVNQRGVGAGSGLELEATAGYLFEADEDLRCIYFALYNEPQRAFDAARARESA